MRHVRPTYDQATQDERPLWMLGAAAAWQFGCAVVLLVALVAMLWTLFLLWPA